MAQTVVIDGRQHVTPWDADRDGPLRLQLVDGHGTIFAEYEVTAGRLRHHGGNLAPWDLSRASQQQDMCTMIGDHVRSVESPT